MKPLRGTSAKRFLKQLDRPEGELVIVLHDVEDPVNVGSAFRIADACGASEMVLTGITAKPPHKLITKVGRGKDHRVKWRYEEDVVAALDGLTGGGFFNCAVELTESAVPYMDFEFPTKTALVVGHEDHGVTRRALERCKAAVFIPMFGKGASLNVHVALAVVAFQAVCGVRA